MDSDEYETLSNDTHRIGIIVSIAEFYDDGEYGSLTPVVHEVDEPVGDGMAAARVRFDGPTQRPSGYRYIANTLRDLADECEKEADKHGRRR